MLLGIFVRAFHIHEAPLSQTKLYNRQNEASGTKGTKRTKLKLLRRNEAYA